MCQPRAPLSDELRQNGAFCITHEDFRWKKAHIKTTSLMGSVLARDLSAKEKALETIMFRDGFLSEAASSNVWVVKKGAVMGVPNDHLVLEGIRYGVLAQLCESQQIPFSLKPIRKEEVFAADELLLTSASKEVLAVTKLDALMIGDARPGPIYRRLYDAYQTLKHHD
jgi:D-alanine transaminase